MLKEIENNHTLKMGICIHSFLDFIGHQIY